MPTKQSFSMLLYTDSDEQGSIIKNLMSPIFPQFFIALNEAQALKTIAEEKINILFVGFVAVADSESAYLRLVENKEVHVDSIVKRRFLFSSETEIRDAFSACNRELFDDYFVTQPLTDPYRIFIRMRFLMRLHRKQEQERLDREAAGHRLRIEEMCEFFDRIIQCEQSFTQMSDQHFRRLFSSITTAIDVLKKGVCDADLSDSQREILLSMIENQTEKSLLEEAESQNQQRQELSYSLQNVSESAQFKKQQSEASIEINFEGVKVLLVEDDTKTQKAIASSLTNAGCLLKTASSARGANEILGTAMPDVLLLDMTLPDMSPLFVINRAIGLNSELKIFLLARPIDRGNVEDCLQAGAADVFIKPIDKDVLLHKLHGLLKLS